MQLIAKENSILLTFSAPIEAFEIALQHPLAQPLNHRSEIEKYLLQHLSINDSTKSIWNLQLTNVESEMVTDKAIGIYPELIVQLKAWTQHSKLPSALQLKCDLIIHQIPNQAILFSYQPDGNEVSAFNSVIEIDRKSGNIFPLNVVVGTTSPRQNTKVTSRVSTYFIIGPCILLIVLLRKYNNKKMRHYNLVQKYS
ncbi:MAG: hypothetical protein ACKO96_33505 [Flammeovirgaceae bacterium]